MLWADENEETEEVATEAPKTEKPAEPNHEVSFEEYLTHLYTNKKNILKETWSKYPYVKEVNGISYLEFEGKEKHTKGHIFMFPSWGQIAKLIPFAKIGANQNYDTFIFLPLPEINQQIPFGEEQNKDPHIDQFLQYVDAALSTIGTHEKANIILLSGGVTGWILPQITNGEMIKTDGLILFDAFYKDRDANAVLAEYFSNYKGFTLDLISIESNNWLNEAVSKRKFICEKEGKAPMLLKTIKSDDQEELEQKFSNYLKKTDFTLLQPKKKKSTSKNY